MGSKPAHIGGGRPSCVRDAEGGGEAAGPRGEVLRGSVDANVLPSHFDTISFGRYHST